MDEVRPIAGLSEYRPRPPWRSLQRLVFIGGAVLFSQVLEGVRPALVRPGFIRYLSRGPFHAINGQGILRNRRISRITRSLWSVWKRIASSSATEAAPNHRHRLDAMGFQVSNCGEKIVLKRGGIEISLARTV
jgi:hypothetical protein